MKILEAKNSGQNIEQARYDEIITMLRYVSRTFDLTIPEHWL